LSSREREAALVMSRTNQGPASTLAPALVSASPGTVSFLGKVGPEFRFPLTTAMGILPHRDPQRALDLAFSLDIPFWPQLPLVSYSEDTYVQTALGLPGLVVDHEGRRLLLDPDAFLEGLEDYLALEEDHPALSLGPGVSLTWPLFRERVKQEGERHAAVRGQFMGPISLSLMIKDPGGKPVIYHDTVREVVILHVARKVNRHLRELEELHPNAFVWVDEPGLEFLFAGIAGYTAERARRDLELFLSQLEGLKGVHLCGNPDWDLLLSSDLDLLSLDAYHNAEILAGYRRGLAGFLRRGMVAWGIVPTHADALPAHSPVDLARRLRGLWARLEEEGLGETDIAGRSMLTPATCCLVNPDLTVTVERAFRVLNEVAKILRGEI